MPPGKAGSIPRAGEGPTSPLAACFVVSPAAPPTDRRGRSPYTRARGRGRGRCGSYPVLQAQPMHPPVMIRNCSESHFLADCEQHRPRRVAWCPLAQPPRVETTKLAWGGAANIGVGIITNNIPLCSLENDTIRNPQRPCSNYEGPYSVRRSPGFLASCTLRP